MGSNLGIIVFRTVLGFLISPLITGLIVGLEIYSVSSRLKDLGFAVGMSAFLGYPISWLIGIPVYFVLAAVRWTGFFTYVAVGTVMPIVMIVVFRDPVFDGIGDMLQSPLQHLRELQTPFVFGSIPTAAFWLIARPDRARAFFSR